MPKKIATVAKKAEALGLAQALTGRKRTPQAVAVRAVINAVLKAAKA